MMKAYRLRLQVGFTLIEILVVLFIISIVSSVALLSISHNENKQIESFANEITQMVTLAEEQAILQPSVLGLSLQEHAFEFSSLQLAIDSKEKKVKKSSWAPLNDRILGKHAIPKNIRVDVRVLGDKRKIDTDDEEEDRARNRPQIIISTNGDITPFSIYIGKEGEKPRYVITGDANGNVTNKLLS